MLLAGNNLHLQGICLLLLLLLVIAISGVTVRSTGLVHWVLLLSKNIERYIHEYVHEINYIQFFSLSYFDACDTTFITNMLKQQAQLIQSHFRRRSFLFHYLVDLIQWNTLRVKLLLGNDSLEINVSQLFKNVLYRP